MASALSHIPVDDTRSDTAFSGHANEGPPEVRRSFDRPKSQSDHLSDTTMEHLLGDEEDAVQEQKLDESNSDDEVIDQNEGMDYESNPTQLEDQSGSFGTSAPRAGFFTPSSMRKSGLSYVFSSLRSGISSYETPQSFATARSSLASYATASSGPKKTWAYNARTKESFLIPPTKGNNIDNQSIPISNQMSLESLEDAILRCILKYQKSSSDDLCSRPYPSSDDERLLQKDGIRKAVQGKLLPLQHGVGGVNSGSMNLLDSVVNGVFADACSLLEKQDVPWRSTHSPSNMERDLTLVIYEYASTKPQLRDLISPWKFSGGQIFTSEWLIYLHTRGLMLDDSQTLDWSGRGQHVEYLPNEDHLIPLKEERLIGNSATAVVHSVRCRRIRLARKTIRCNRRLTKEAAVIEVEHLQRLQHRHIVRLVGTYTYKKDLAILVYPVARWNLEEYLDELVETEYNLATFNRVPLTTFVGCLSNAVKFIHDQNVKHMDIKPANLLVRNTAQGQRIYIADFGIARAYKSAEDSFTDSPTSFTRIYAAPEVVMQDRRGFPADIFSLGCVFMEILSTLTSMPGCNERIELIRVRSSRDDQSYHANLDAVLEWHQRIMRITSQSTNDWGYLDRKSRLSLAGMMLSANPNDRPSAAGLVNFTYDQCCGLCDAGPEPFEAAGAD
jgi:serine/threonine protein kinase